MLQSNPTGYDLTGNLDTLQPEMEYFHQRCKAIGITPDKAKEHFLSCDRYGNILQFIVDFNGNPYTYLSEEGKRKKKRYESQKTQSEGKDLSIYEKPLALLRYHPEFLAKNKWIGKYKWPSKYETGYGVLPMPTPLVVSRYKEKAKGGTITITEGFFKALSMGNAGMETVSFSGIQNFRTTGIEDYLLRRNPESVVVFYDGDARQLKVEEGKPITDKRPRNFLSSATRFASDFFSLKENKEATLYFGMVREDLPEKGMDDILEARPEEREAIVKEYNEKRNGKYFHFIKLTKTTYQKKLIQFFRLNTPSAFYNHYKAQIKYRPFVFNGIEYQQQTLSNNNGLFSEYHEELRMLSEPMKVSFDKDTIQVQKYISEESSQLDKILSDNQKIAIEAPTGAGKTSFFLGHGSTKGWIDKKKEKAVLVVPTVSLCKQLSATTKGVFALHGTITPVKKNKALQASKIVCTYDVLRHISDLEERVLIIDEAHNLINHHGFRAEVLQRIVERIDKAKKAIFISGTPPLHLIKELNFHFVKVQRSESNVVKVTSVEVDKNSVDCFTAETAQRIISGTEPGRISFVYYNNEKGLEQLKKVLVSSGNFLPDEIDIITRSHVDSGDSKTINQITTYQEVKPGVAVVLSSCLIAEGVNIKNKNIGTVYMVNNRNLDNFLQYIARFRMMKALNVVSIRPPQKSVSSSFKLSVLDRIEYLKETARSQLKLISKEIEEHRALYDDSEAEFFDYIFPSYHYQSATTTEFIYLDDEGQPRVDILKVIRVAKERVEMEMDNIYFNTQLDKYPNIHFTQSTTEPTSATDNSLLDTVETIQKEEAEERKRIEGDLKAILLSTPGVAVGAYIIGLEKAGNRGRLKRIMEMAGDIEVDKETATEFREKYKPFFKKRWFTELIVAFCKLHGIGASKQVVEDRINSFNASAFNQEWSQLKHKVFTSMYNDAYKRKKLTPGHKLDVKFYNKVKTIIENELKGGVIEASKAEEVIYGIMTFKKWNNSNEVTEVLKGISLSSAKVKSILSTLFDIKVKARYKNKDYHLSQLIQPFTSTKNEAITATPTIHNTPEKMLLICYDKSNLKANVRTLKTKRTEPRG